MFKIIQRRYWYFGLSLVIILPGLIALGVWGLPLAIDFTGGTLLDIQFPATTQPIDLAQVRAVYAANDAPEVSVPVLYTAT